MGMLCSFIRFENLHELKRLCHWGPIIALSVITICSVVAIIDSIFWYWPLDSAGGSVNFIMLINWTVMILYNYFNAMFIGPGYVPLGWKPEKPEDMMFLQYCKVCEAYKAPRSHHCRKCNRCVMKMDHHCPWINNCCGHRNHTSFTLFLLLAPLGCIHAAYIFIMTMYTQLYHRISFGWSSVKIDMSLARRDLSPVIPFGLSAFAASLFALGMALGTTIAVGMLFFIQLRVILRNKTSIESWIEEKVEQLKQKKDKQVRSVQYRVIENYGGACCPVTKGIKTFFTTPCSEEPRIELQKGELILATRGLKHWMYGDKILEGGGTTEAGTKNRGWFPRRCVEKCVYDNGTDQTEGKKGR